MVRPFRFMLIPKVLLASIHKSNNCVDCHQNYNPEEFPHNENNNKAQCSPCHEEEVNFTKNVFTVKLMQREID